jgi:hypothetical protein
MNRILIINDLHLGPFYITWGHVSIIHGLTSVDLTCNCDHGTPTPTIRSYIDTVTLSVGIYVSERSNISINSRITE